MTTYLDEAQSRRKTIPDDIDRHYDTTLPPMLARFARLRRIPLSLAALVAELAGIGQREAC